MSDDDKCTIDPVMASCQHIRFIEEHIEIYHYSQDGQRIVDGVDVNIKTQIPQGEHFLHGARVFNSISSIMEAA